MAVSKEFLSESSKRASLSQSVVTAWLAAGTIDIAVASVYFPLAGKFKLILLYQGIASGILGARAFAGGVPAAALGLACHYFIALLWTSFFFLVFPRFKTLSRNPIATAAGYGVFVSVVMSFIVLPLSNVHHNPIRVENFVISTVILIFTIGTPITLFARKYYSNRT